jgi:hypothetical protein
MTAPFTIYSVLLVILVALGCWVINRLRANPLWLYFVLVPIWICGIPFSFIFNQMFGAFPEGAKPGLLPLFLMLVLPFKILEKTRWHWKKEMTERSLPEIDLDATPKMAKTQKLR